ncbi:hypothetical protein [Virgisporangium aurantiacum]|uniref:Serine/threonine protein kinase n=1 Tax=Virgisporangium aurantiacum TaxID=175570 RepID=A0A8J4E704_9ACTN|nr:hypothetical protein [Virgisporangium aurantiacum]GIJ63774.1 hypothetical protein Vau01_112900 [Virgisporangium aurantiacum]
MFSVRTIVLIIAAGAALAACDPAPTTTSGPTAPPTTTPPTTATTAASPANTATDTPPPTSTRTPTPGNADAPDACPVSAQTLLGVLKGTDIAHRGGDPTALEGVSCYKNYAYARDADKTQTHERAYFLFGYVRPGNRWIPLNLGTGGVCEGYVLDKAVRDRLGEGC